MKDSEIHVGMFVKLQIGLHFPEVKIISVIWNEVMEMAYYRVSLDNQELPIDFCADEFLNEITITTEHHKYNCCHSCGCQYSDPNCSVVAGFCHSKQEQNCGKQLICRV